MAVDVVTETVIGRPVSVVAGYVADPSYAPEWYANIDSVEWVTDPPLEVGSRVAFRARFLGRTLAYTYEIVEYEPETTLVMCTSQGPFPMETTYRWRPEDDDRTHMTLRNRGTPSGFASVTAPVLAAAMRRANTKDLDRLRSILELPAAPGLR